MFRLFGACTLAAVLSFSASAEGQTAGSLSDKFARVTAKRASSTRKAAMPVRTLLRKRVDKVEWVEITFEEVLDWLRGLADDNVNIVPGWNALNAEGVDTDSPVTLQLRDTTVAEVMNEVLGQLSEDDQLLYRGERNMLRISTKDDFGRKLEVKVYDVTDILFKIPDMGQNAPMIDLQQASRSGGSRGGGGGGRGVFSGGSSGQTEELEQEDEELEERLEELRDMLYRVVAPESWADEGGGPGTIDIFNNRFLVVRNTIEVHELLNGYFEYSR
ncbi:MAG: hypothetical protein ACYTFA_06595 [Planctomycetota bacterium]|jgi:hypothetical protein